MDLGSETISFTLCMSRFPSKMSARFLEIYIGSLASSQCNVKPDRTNFKLSWHFSLPCDLNPIFWLVLCSLCIGS